MQSDCDGASFRPRRRIGSPWTRLYDRISSLRTSKMTRKRWWSCSILGIILVIIVGAAHFLSPLIRQLHLRRDMTWYDLGWYGFAPTRRHHSFEHPVTNVEFTRRDARCSQDYIFFAPRGPATVPGAVILDHTGELVWRQLGMGGDTQDFRVQEYRGEKFLTFWAGHENNGRKEGLWYMVSQP